MRYFRQRIVIIAVLCLFSLEVLTKNFENLETYRDQINKSQVLLLQRDRNQASQLLISAINKEGIKSPSYIELSRVLKKTVETFLSEKAQQTYELALSIYPTDKSLAIEKIKESLNLDLLNGLALKALNFTLLSQRECSLAKKIRLDLIKLNPFDVELEKLFFLELICQKYRAEALAYLAKIDPLLQTLPFWKVAKQRILGNEFLLAQNDSRLLTSEYPELVYIYWISEKDIKKRKIFAYNYKKLCQTPISFDKAYSWSDPWVCEHIKEIDDFQIKEEKTN